VTAGRDLRNGHGRPFGRFSLQQFPNSMPPIRWEALGDEGEVYKVFGDILCLAAPIIAGRVILPGRWHWDPWKQNRPSEPGRLCREPEKGCTPTGTAGNDRSARSRCRRGTVNKWLTLAGDEKKPGRPDNGQG